MQFLKVTNKRLGEVNVHTPPLNFPPGVSYHKVEVFDNLRQNHPNVLAALSMHEQARELLFEPIEFEDGVIPEAPAYVSGLLPFIPAPEVPEAGKPELPASGVPALSSDPEQALAQIKAETNAAVLDAWFGAKPEPTWRISDAIMNRIGELS
jgi:hypothetical protein